MAGGEQFQRNGRKYWPSSPGWDARGTNMSTVIVRTDPDRGGTEGLSALVVERDTLQFALEHEVRFRLMWAEAHASRAEHLRVGGTSRVVLRQAVEDRAIAQWPGDADGSRRATVVWASVHGLAELLLAGQPGPARGHEAIADHRELLWHGLSPRG